MAKTRRILFVCSGNTCRSPMAAVLLRRAAAAHPTLDGLQVESAGTHPHGEEATADAVRVLRQGWGIDLHHLPRGLENLAGEFDLVLAVDARVRGEVTKRRPDLHAKLLGAWVPAGNGADVDDPHGQGLRGLSEMRSPAR